ARRARPCPRISARQAAQRRAPPGSAGQRRAARLCAARPDPRGLRRRRPLGSRARGSRLRSRHRAQSRSARRPERVQTAAGAAGCARLTQGLRQGPAPADHEPLAWLNARLRAFSPELALVAASVLYGATFTIVQDALDDLTATGFILLRFAIGGAALLPLALGRGWRGPAARPTDSPRVLAGCGLALGL